jgi:cobalt/nickel transport system ATP-binding protein
VTKKTLQRVRGHLGYIFQNPDDQLFMPTVYDDVAFGPRNGGLSETEVKERALKALETVGAMHLKDKPPYTLSGGEKRAAAIATVLSMDPDILLMDEPSSDLDPKARRRLITLLDSFAHTRLIASHDLDLILEVCTRIILIRQGRVAFDGMPGDAFRNDGLLEECGLEKPLCMQGIREKQVNRVIQ